MVHSQVWGLLFRVLGSSECFGLIGFTSKWMLRIVVLPFMLSLVVAVIYCVEKGSSLEKAKSHAKGNGFFALFFVSLSLLSVDTSELMCLMCLRRIDSVTRRSATWPLRHSSVDH